MEIMLIALCFSAMTFVLLLRQNALLLFAVAGDEDMKIAPPGGFTSSREDASEIAAKAYLHQKNIGNIDKARQLGTNYAHTLMDHPGQLFDDSFPERQHQQLLLYSYVVNRVIADIGPNSNVAQTILNVYYDVLETNAKELYDRISDPAPFSLYILCERSHNRSDDEIGRVYASLLNKEGNEAVILEGNRLFQSYYAYCKEMLEAAKFVSDN